MLDPIRKAFAKANKVDAALFSANSKGACPDCKGLGVVYTDLAHLDPVVSVCETLRGQALHRRGARSTRCATQASRRLDMQADAALEFFTEKPIRKRAGGDPRRRPRLPHARPAALARSPAASASA